MKPLASLEVISHFATKTQDSWLQAITTFALGEMGMVIQQDNAKSNKKPSLRSRTSTILDSLDDSGDNIDADFVDKKEQSSKKKTRRERPTNPLASLAGLVDELSGKSTDETVDETQESHEVVPQTNSKKLLPFKTIVEIEEIIDVALNHSDKEVRMAAQSAKRMIAGIQVADVRMATYATNRMINQSQNRTTIDEETFMLSTIEKIIFLKKVPFFEGMTIDQLKTLAGVCEEELFEEDTRIFSERDPGGTLYVVVSGKVAIEQEGKRKGSFARLATIDAHSYFGEMNLFDNSPRDTFAIAVQDTLTLRLRREPLIALARQYPELSLELINVLSQRLRDLNNQVVGLTRAKPRELHKLFDQYE
jgi:hypothetical protein